MQKVFAAGAIGFLLVTAPAEAGEVSSPPARLSMPPLTRFTGGIVRRSVDLARAMLAAPECPQIYADFQLESGDSPRDRLDRLGLAPAEFLQTLVFVDGSREAACRDGGAALVTRPGSQVIWVCPAFPGIATGRSLLSASLIIHESLHALGLGESPPDSNAITRAVEHRCWRLGPAPRAPRLAR